MTTKTAVFAKNYIGIFHKFSKKRKFFCSAFRKSEDEGPYKMGLTNTSNRKTKKQHHGSSVMLFLHSTADYEIILIINKTLETSINS